jgi:hypothetical protein
MKRRPPPPVKVLDLSGMDQTRVCYTSDVGPGRPETTTLVPWLCPVCQGRGFVPVGFYNPFDVSAGSTTAANPSCKSCDATGIVWGAS